MRSDQFKWIQRQRERQSQEHDRLFELREIQQRGLMIYLFLVTLQFCEVFLRLVLFSF
jgi:hypothetical protein